MKENESFEKNCKVHLSEFAKSFINKNWIERWNHFLIEKPEKAFIELMKFPSHRNNLTTDYLDESSLSKIFGNNYQNLSGIYFDGENPEKIRLADAFERGSGNDAIFSIKAGKLAVFFFHEAEVFLCKK